MITWLVIQQTLTDSLWKFDPKPNTVWLQNAALRRLSDMQSRQRLRSSLTDQLDVRQSQCSTVGDRSFAVAGARLWNSLPPDIVVCHTLLRFHEELWTFLFRQLYIILLCFSFSLWSLRFLRATALCYSAYMLSPVRLSVRPSVRPSHGCIIQKRLKLGLWNFHLTVALSL